MTAFGVRRATVCREPGRVAAWPANYGMWAWGPEVLVCFTIGWLGRVEGMHARDKSRPFVPMLARSLDRGASWSVEPFTGATPGSPALSADEHVSPDLAAGPRLSPDDAEFPALQGKIDFTDPETIVLCGRTGLAAGARSWFYVSQDRGRSWSGPHALPGFGVPGVAARTDVVALSRDAAIFGLTAAKSDGTEGRVFAAWTGDGGRTFERRGWVGPEPAGWSIMPSSVRLGPAALLAALRCSGPTPPRPPRPPTAPTAPTPPGAGAPEGQQNKGSRAHWIDLYRSDDGGSTWQHVARPVPDTGEGGNPPALLALRDGRLVLVYGSRRAPFGLRCVQSRNGVEWSAPTVLTDDAATHDVGYPRAVALDDGSVLACYYRADEPDGERFVEAVRWLP